MAAGGSVNDALVGLAAASNGRPVAIDGALVAAILHDARERMHDLLRALATEQVDTERLLAPAFNTAGYELYLDRGAALSVKLAVGVPDTFATVACRTLLINLQGSDLVIECFDVEDLRAHRTETLRLAPHQAIACVDPRHAYRFMVPQDVVLLGKLQFKGERALRDYHHVFKIVGEAAEYHATIPFDANAYLAAYNLAMANCLGQLQSSCDRHRDRLIAGPTPFLWEAAKLCIRARHPACYDFLDALLAREDESFDRAARATLANVEKVVPRAD